MSDINENVKELFNLRYAAYDGETWDEMCERVISNTFDKLTEKERDAYEEIWSDMGFDDTKPLRQALLEAMQDKCIIPNSPALINAGFDNRSLCACCVLTPPDDNIESIGDFNTRVMLATKAGFGVGANFSKLRGAGSVVNGKDGVASGPVSFMTLADAHLRCLKQNGASAKGGKSMNRNGAAMMVLNCEHPDYELFINAKREAGMTNTNISGWITEEWWNKAYTKGTPEYELFEKQLHTMYDYAECSVLFADTINKAWCDKNNPIEATNPCVVGDTLILTKDGYVPIEELVGKEVEVWNGEEWSKVIPKVTGHKQHCFKFTFSNGSTVTCTDYHGFWLTKDYGYMKNAYKIEAKDVRIGDRLIKWHMPEYKINCGEYNKEAYTQGFFSGDGCCKNNGKPIIYLYNSKINLFNKFDCTHVSEIRFTNNNKNVRVIVSLPWKYSSKTYVPFDKSNEYKLWWLSGLIDSDGYVTKDNGIQIASVDKTFLENVSKMLMTIGVQSVVQLVKNAHKRSLPNGHGQYKEYDCKALYRLSISSVNVNTLIKYGLTTYRVHLNEYDLEKPDRSHNITVVKIENAGIADVVYCFNEPKRHMGMFDRVILSNCGEEPLPNGGVCDLVAVNMTKYAMYMDGYYVLAYNHIVEYNTLAYILAESILSTTYLPLEEMKVSCDMYHNIGVGIMGLADMLIMLGYVYGSDESASVIRNVMEYTYSYLDKISKIAGELLGNYHMIDGTEGNRRNAMLNTVAPTGTISMFADVSSGIEPIFSVAYEKIANGSTVTVVNPLFRYMLSKEFDDQKVDELIEKCKNLESIQHITEIPKHIRKLFVTNVDVDPVDQVDIVALVQKYIDAGISKTIILPNDYPFEKMRGLIGRAHVFKCKGITVYRNGTREACINLVKDKDNGNEYVLDTYAPEYETDTLGNERSLSSNVCVATNIRQKTGCGHLTIDVCSDPALNENLLKVYVSNSGGCRSNQEAIGRSMYIAARYMTPEQRKGYYNEIVKAFSKIKCDSCKRNSKAECKSCPAGIAKAIKTHIDMIDCGAITVDKQKFETVCKDNSLKTFRKDSRRETCSENVNNIEYIKCPDCGATIPRFGKCYDCPNCGYHTCVSE